VEGISADGIAVALGVHALSSDAGEQINVKQIYSHPQYNSTTADYDYDIALLELEGLSTYSTLPLVESNSLLSGSTATAIGWGLTDPNDENSFPDALRQVSLPLVEQSACRDAMGEAEITDRMLCAGYAQGGKDSCQGDSGGPLLISDAGVWKQAGIVSWGNGCAEENSYGVYTRVPNFISWVEGYTGELSPEPPPPPTADSLYGLWNGYLSMTNVLELENLNDGDVTVNVYVYSGSGSHAVTIRETISARAKKDILLANYPGFAADYYGVVRVDGEVRGRVFYYRPQGEGFSSFDFGFGVELSKAMRGTSYIGFNTFQPSDNPFEAGNLVANWLSVVNLGSSSAEFTVSKYNAAGVVLSSETKNIASLSRMDLDGGHIDPGPQNVGLLKVTPRSSQTPYLAQLMRYGYGSAGDFDFAFPLIAVVGRQEIYAPISSMAGIQNWLEVVNVSEGSADVVVKFFNQTGAEVNSFSGTLLARSQLHFNASAALGAAAVGHAAISSTSGAVLAAQSMYYFRDSTDGGITTMYGSQARADAGGELTGGYNLFLGMYNYLKLVNTGPLAINVDVTLTSLFSAGSSHTYVLPARSSLDLGLHEGSVFGTQANSYGALSVEAQSGEIITEVLRLKPGGVAAFEFVAPTPLF
jgi:hypothetical protein